MPRTDTAAIVIAAPPDRVFQAMITPRALESWLPPAGMSGRMLEFNPVPGGSYRMVLAYDDPATAGKRGDGTDVTEVRFVEIAPPDRLVQAVEFESDDPRFAGTMTMTWTLTRLEHGTELRVAATGVPDGISAEDHAAGLASSLDKLRRYVER